MTSKLLKCSVTGSRVRFRVVRTQGFRVTVSSSAGGSSIITEPLPCPVAGVAPALGWLRDGLLLNCGSLCRCRHGRPTGTTSSHASESVAQPWKANEECTSERGEQHQSRKSTAAATGEAATALSSRTGTHQWESSSHYFGFSVRILKRRRR